MTFTELLGHVGLFGGAVMCCLALLSVFSVGMIVDKHLRFRSASRETQIFKPVFGKFLRGGELQELIDTVPLHQKSYVAQVVSAGILEYDGVRQKGGDPVASLELVTSALRDSMSETLIQLKLAARRHQDFADVVNLIRVHNLDESYQEKLHPSLHRDYVECLEEKRREDEYESRED